MLQKLHRVGFLVILFVLAIGTSLLMSPQLFTQELPGDREVVTVGDQQYWVSWATQEFGTLMPPVVPVAVFGQEGELILKEMPISDEALAPALEDSLLFGGDCSGGQCAGGGNILDCPSGGTTCDSDEVCACHCEEQSDGSYSAVHRCEELQVN